MWINYNLIGEISNKIKFSIEGPGEIVATDNGDPTEFIPFTSHEREAFSGLVLVIIRSKQGNSGQITVSATSHGLEEAQIIIKSQ